MPAAACVPKKARARKAIINTRKRFEAACGKATNSWKQLGAVATISGVGFWDEPHTQNRTLRTSPSYTRSRRSSSSLAAARESSSHGTPKIVARKAYGTGGQGIVSERLTQDTLRFRGCHDEPSLQRTRREEALRKINAVGLVSRAWADE